MERGLGEFTTEREEESRAKMVINKIRNGEVKKDATSSRNNNGC